MIEGWGADGRKVRRACDGWLCAGATAPFRPVSTWRRPNDRSNMRDARHIKGPRDPECSLRLPNARYALVTVEKVEEYLLATDHPTGAEKARIFAGLGYRLRNASQLRIALGHIARTHAVQRVLSTPYGTKYVLEGYLDGVNGRRAWIRSVWIEEMDMRGPRFVTAYPAKRLR